MNPEQENVIFFDTTLRDGAQAAEKQIKTDEAVKIAVALEEAGVNVAEMPMATSGPNRDMIRQIFKTTKQIELAAFVRDGVEKDIVEAVGTLDEAIHQGRARMSMLTPTAECLREAKGVSKEEAMRRMTSGIENSIKEFTKRGQAPKLHIYFEGASQVKDLGFMDELTQAAIRRANELTPPEYRTNLELTLDYPDTHGTAGSNLDDPNEHEKLHRHYSQLVSGMAAEFAYRRLITAAHCHDDNGLAVENTIQAYRAGARQLGVTVLGVGERSGNADIIHVVQRFQTSGKINEITVNPEHMRHLAEVTAPVFGIDFSQHRVVGNETGSTAAGIHADKINADPDSYIKKNPADFGAPAYIYKVGPAMGRSGVAGVLGEMGVHLPLSICSRIYEDYLKSIERGEDADYAGKEGRLNFIRTFVYRNPEVVRRAEIENGKLIYLRDFDPKSRVPEEKGGKRRTHLDFTYAINGEEKSGSGDSTGGSLPIVEETLEKELGLNLKLTHWETYNTDEGADSEVVAMVTMRCMATNTERTGYSVDGDEKVASVQAMLHAISSFPQAEERLKKADKSI
ncbi:hypothetical protein JXD20_01900 [Candidatus Peregrinibacteria bacterium]|nr:hypothetical protein [Candidatus Peregrinibacteria bacterium]